MEQFELQRPQRGFFEHFDEAFRRPFSSFPTYCWTLGAFFGFDYEFPVAQRPAVVFSAVF